MQIINVKQLHLLLDVGQLFGLKAAHALAQKNDVSRAPNKTDKGGECSPTDNGYTWLH